ncbi:histidine phosphatase family protein [Billgrantia azerbaijanica]|nr:histidine phosphatase family protein [Halomonas azerbaijanica]
MSNANSRRHNRYLLMRHGHSEANAQGRIISDPRRGLDAYGLSPEGHAQLERVLAEWPWPAPTRLLHSDFLRTTQTAARVAARFGLTPTPEPRLRERHFGTLDGGPDDRYPAVWALDAEDPDHRAFGVESVASVAARLCGVIDALERRYRGETLLLVSHGDPLQILLTALEGRPLTAHRQRAPLLPADVVLLG